MTKPLSPAPKKTNLGKIPFWAREDRSKDFLPSIATLMNHIGRKTRLIILVGTVLNLIGSFLGLIAPQYLSKITDIISESISGGFDPDSGMIFHFCIILVSIYGLSLIFSILGNITIFSTSETIGKRICDEMNAKILNLDLNYLDSSNVGDVMSRMSNDTDTLRGSSADALSHLISATLTATIAVAIMLYTNVYLAIVAIVPTIVGIFLMSWIMKTSQKYFRIQQKNLGKINNLVEGSYYGHDILKIYNGEEKTRVKFDTINNELLNSMYRASLVEQAMPLISGFINNLNYVLVCVIGAILVKTGGATFGTVVAFIFYVGLFSKPLDDMSNSFSRLQTVSAASERIFELLEAPEVEKDEFDEHASVFEGEVELKNVYFSYNEEERVLQGISYLAKPGTKTAIVGPTGAGKTTIASLLMRFYEPDSGEILIDGYPIKRMTKMRVRNMYSMVDQEAWMLNSSLRDNLTYTKQEVTDSDVENACDAVGISNLIKSLPDGYETKIDENFGLSAGQKQQLMIARAMIRDAPMVILDEATSSIDSRTEKQIQDAMNLLMNGRTSFIIAHRLSTIKDADVILVLEEGKIVEKGTHDELLNLQGKYWDLYQSQFENCN